MIENQNKSVYERNAPLLVLKNVVLFPKSIVPVFIGRSFSAQVIESAIENHERHVLVGLQKNADKEIVGSQDIHPICTYATILQIIKTQKNSLKVLLEGIERTNLVSVEQIDTCWYGRGESIVTPYSGTSTHFEAQWRIFKSMYQDYAAHFDKMPENILPSCVSLEDAELLIDTVASQAHLKIHQKQQILETVDLHKRLELLLFLLKTELEIFETEKRIRQSVQNQIETSQREYYLNEQLKAIEKELKGDKRDNNGAEYRKQAKAAQMPAEITERVEKEISRLETMQALSAEATVSRTYIEWLLALPWKKHSKDRVSIDQAESILDTKHFGLQKAKERILEFIAAKKFTQDTIRAPIICLVGPPGVGKTSLGQSIADSLNREFIRISLGGIRDEAEIRGHRKTYVGALPGKIIQGMRRAKTVNPLFLLDEIDKISSDIHGDPAAALLEVLDPEQNKQFMDNYLEVPYDLSKVIFIATANTTDSLPCALLDRMEIVSLSGYSKDEKMVIAKNFILPRQYQEHKVTPAHCIITDEALALIITDYTREAGVRHLERKIIRTLRKTIQLNLLKKSAQLPVTITQEKLKEYFKTPLYKTKDSRSKIAKIGIANGLAWTEMGGDVLEVEVAISPGKGNVIITGQLGEVMQESAQAALSYLRTQAKHLGLSKNFALNNDIHIHVPEGATPKDGPSAGITICTALASAFTKIAIKPDIAMTGEITLQGRVLSVGGLKEKFLAAQAHGYSAVLVPDEYKEMAEEAFEELTGDTIQLIFVETMDDVLRHALVTSPFTGTQKRSTKMQASAQKRKGLV